MQSLNSIHLNGLRAVEAVARLGSLQSAADELGVTIGAVSQQILKTERQLGRVLFTRTQRGLVATPFALSILPRLSAGFAALSDVVTLSRKRDETILTVSVAPVFAARFLVHRLDRFTARHPQIRLRLDATTALVDPETSGVDIGIRVGAGHWPGTHAELLLEQDVFPVCTPAMAKGLTVSADLLDRPAVIDARSMFSWENWLAPAGLSGRSLTVRHAFNEASLCLDAAIAGQGVMLAWQTLAVHALVSGQLVAPFPLRVKTGYAHYFVTPPGRRDSPNVKAFKTWIRQEIDDSMRDLDAVMRGVAIIPPPPSAAPSSP